MLEEVKSFGALAKALATAQGQIQAAKKDSKNPHFKSSYADLASVWEACRIPLSSNGLSIVQIPGTTADGFIKVKTMLLHESGEYIEGEVLMLPRDPGPQAAGSCITYARRYALAAMVGVAPDDDDDGNEASGVNAKKAAQRPPQAPAPASSAPVWSVKNPKAVAWLETELVKRKIASDRFTDVGRRMEGRRAEELDNILFDMEHEHL